MGMTPAMLGMMPPTLPVEQDDGPSDDDAPLSQMAAAVNPANAADGTAVPGIPPAKASSSSGAPALAPDASSSRAAPSDPAAGAASQARANLAQTRASLYHHNGREDRRINRGTATFKAMPKAWLGVTDC